MYHDATKKLSHDTGNMHKKFAVARTYGFLDMSAERHTGSLITILQTSGRESKKIFDKRRQQIQTTVL